MLMVALAATAGLAWPAVAEETEESGSGEERLEQVESQIGILAEEMSRFLISAAVPEEKDLVSVHGLGPAASKVYLRDAGLSIGGYGELRLRTYVSQENDGQGGARSPDNVFDALRAVLYVGYKFNDRMLVNSEFEFEHAGTGGGGSVSTEFLTLDYFITNSLGLRAGLVLMPMGLVNEMHEPTFFFGAERPEVERQIIPSTWRENGAGVFGDIGDRIHFRVYAVNGFKASGFSVAGLRGGRQKGSRAIANQWAVVARLDADPIDSLTLGGSVYVGPSGQHETVVRKVATVDTSFRVPDVLTTLYEVHARYRKCGLTLSGLFTQAFIDDAASLNSALGNAPMASVAKQMLGGYAEIAYDLLPLFSSETAMSFEPFFRYERLDTQHVMPQGALRNTKYTRDIYTVGASFKPIPRVVVKLDYRNIRPESDADDVADQVQVGVGYVF